MTTCNEREKDGSVVAKWTPAEENIFVQIIVEQVKKGNRPTTTFSKKAWNEIIEDFYKKTCNRYAKMQFINKFNKLRMTYREFKQLHDIPTGFGWDPITRPL